MKQGRGVLVLGKVRLGNISGKFLEKQETYFCIKISPSHSCEDGEILNVYCGGILKTHQLNIKNDHGVGWDATLTPCAAIAQF
jgi:hypothetical protein